MKKVFKKAISILLVAVMVFGAAPLAGFVGLEFPELNLFGTKAVAATYSGTCGENLTWTFNEDTGELVISGEGNMTINLANAPWKTYCLSIISVVIGNGVTSIGDFAFYGCTSLESITIPDSITTIGHSAFFNCTNLENLTIPDSVTSIDVFAFYGCTCLESVIIPDSVTTIGVGAFECCSNLISVTISDSVTSIGNYVFGLCQSLKSVSIPYGVTSIGDYAFEMCQSLESVSIPDSVTSIGRNAFGLCRSLENITIPDSVTSIGESAFAVCPKLVRITVSPDNTAYSSDEYGVLFDKDKANLIQYSCGNGMTSYNIPDGVTSIGAFAFAGGFNLESVIIPDSVEHIKANAFYASNIEDVYYGGSKSDWEQITIGGGNGIFDSARIHYNSTGPVGGSTETPDNIPNYDSSVVDTYLMPTPTQTTISYGDSIVIHIDPSKISAGGYVEWYPSNGNFSYSVSADGTTCTIFPSKSGNTTFTAIVYDAEGNVVSADTQTMTSKAGFFDKIIAFFKKLFGLTKVIPQTFKNIY